MNCQNGEIQKQHLSWMFVWTYEWIRGLNLYDGLTGNEYTLWTSLCPLLTQLKSFMFPTETNVDSCELPTSIAKYSIIVGPKAFPLYRHSCNDPRGSNWSKNDALSSSIAFARPIRRSFHTNSWTSLSLSVCLSVSLSLSLFFISCYPMNFVL